MFQRKSSLEKQLHVIHKVLDKRYYVEPRKHTHSSRPPAGHVEGNKKVREEHIALYIQRYEQGQDLFTGKDLSDGKAGK
jgi:hypothetical protein